MLLYLIEVSCAHELRVRLKPCGAFGGGGGSKCVSVWKCESVCSIAS